MEMHKEVFKKFKIVGLNYFYGDYFDSRIYVSHILSKTKSNNILDVGCGAGVLLGCAVSDSKIGVDMDFNTLKQAKKIDKKIEPILCDAQYLPFKNYVFETITAMHLFPVIKNMDDDWEKAMGEVHRVSKKKSMLIITGANRTSKHFKKTHSIEHRKKYLNYKQQIKILEKNYETFVEGYGPHSNWIMYSFKIIYKIPETILKILNIEKFIFWFLKSSKYLKNGRSYVIICKSKEIDQNDKNEVVRN